MQDSNPKQNNKQYFDIMSSPKPDATSRPVINNDPVQTDPMVSNSSQASNTPVVNPEPETVGVVTPVPTSGASTEIPDQNVAVDIPAVPGGADPEAVEYPVAEEAKASVAEQANTDDGLTSSNEPSDSSVPETNVVSENTSDQTTQSVASDQTTPAITSEPANAIPLENQHVVSHNPAGKKPLIKKVIGVVILVVLIIAAFLVYKYKLGK